MSSGALFDGPDVPPRRVRRRAPTPFEREVLDALRRERAFLINWINWSPGGTSSEAQQVTRAHAQIARWFAALAVGQRVLERPADDMETRLVIEAEGGAWSDDFSRVVVDGR